MAHAVVNAWSERWRHENICGKFVHNAIASTSLQQCNCITQVFSFECLWPSPGQRLFRVLKRSPFS